VGIELAHQLAFQLDAVGGMHDAVANGVRDGGVSDDLVLLRIAGASRNRSSVV